MKSLEDRYDELADDPKKRILLFRILVGVSTGMLILGCIIIVVVFALNLTL